MLIAFFRAKPLAALTGAPDSKNVDSIPTRPVIHQKDWLHSRRIPRVPQPLFRIDIITKWDSILWIGQLAFT